eukprot:scaffold3443_cov33-Prasinocladus_malaysianus.AAC.1
MAQGWLYGANSVAELSQAEEFPPSLAPHPSYIYCADGEFSESADGPMALTKEWTSSGPKPSFLISSDYVGFWQGPLSLQSGKYQITVSCSGAVRLAILSDSGSSILVDTVNSAPASASSVVDIPEGETAFLSLLAYDNTAGSAGKLEVWFQELVSCGDMAHGDIESRTRYATAEVSGDAASCQSEEQTRTCENGVWGPWSGSYQYSACGSSCAPGCFASLLADTECQAECNTASCSFDNGVCRVLLLEDLYSAKWMAYTNQRDSSVHLLEQICSDDNLNSEDSTQHMTAQYACVARDHLKNGLDYMGRASNDVGFLQWSAYIDLVDRYTDQVCGYQQQIKDVDIMRVVVGTSDALLESVTANVNSSILALNNVMDYRLDTITDVIEENFVSTKDSCSSVIDMYVAAAAELEQMQADMAAGFTSVEARLTELDLQIASGFAEIDGTLTEMGNQLESGFEEMNEQFDNVQEQFDQLDVGLATVLDRVSENRRELESLSDSVTKVQLQ